MPLSTKRKIKRKINTEEIRKFALTLFAYSPKAYIYLRKFLPLPHTLTRWLSVIDGNSGKTKEAILSVMKKVTESEHPLVFALILHEMSIKKQIEWDGTQYVGFVNLGENIDDDTLPGASNALVYLLVPLNSNWKVPVAYYLTGGLTGEVLENLTSKLLTHLHSNSIDVHALMCDGCGGNQSMLSSLGVYISYPLTTSFFPYPADESKKVYMLLDNCHMLKLVRNMLAKYRNIRNKLTGGVISWDLIEKLHNLQ